jgi:hypothetical protein
LRGHCLNHCNTLPKVRFVPRACLLREQSLRGNHRRESSLIPWQTVLPGVWCAASLGDVASGRRLKFDD